MSASDLEVEWQFDALDLRPVERWLAALPGRAQREGQPTLTALAKPVRRLVDHYLDTPQWRIRQAGVVLRTRTRGRNEEATLKNLSEAGEGGLRIRVELTEPLGEGGMAELGAEGPVGRRVAAVVGTEPLVQILEVRTRRRPFSLRVAGEEVAEIALDDTQISSIKGDRPVQLRRVEVEVVPSWASRLEVLVTELRLSCGLQPATLSKFEAGLLGLDIPVPQPPDLGPTGVLSTCTLGELAYAVLRRQLSVLLAREAGTRLGEDIEELHDMRVATRRLRAAFDLFTDALPLRAPYLRTELGWIASVLGHVRDLDVQLARMDELEAWSSEVGGHAHPTSPLAALRVRLEHERDLVREDMLAALNSERWERLREALMALVRQGPPRRPIARVAAEIGAPQLVAVPHDRALKAARRAHKTGVAADFHRLRIRCKRLRYSLEFTSDIYGERTDRFTKQLARLQDKLGLMQDAEVAMARLWQLATVADPALPALPAETVFAMGGAAERYRVEAAQLLKTMDKRLRVLRGKFWDDLAGLMERRRDQAEADLAAAQAEAELKAAEAAAQKASSLAQTTSTTPLAEETSAAAPTEPLEVAPPRSPEPTVARPFNPVGFAATTPAPPPFPAWPPANNTPAPFSPPATDQPSPPTNGHSGDHGGGPGGQDDAEGSELGQDPPAS